MNVCEVLVVGGGPAGSSCAWALRRAGVDVVVMDKATFPRDKVCAGWVTPPVVDALQIDLDDYRSGRTLQPITGFRVGLIGDGHTIDSSYDRPVSFGIRRCEFDHYLLRRSGARLQLDTPLTSIRRDGTDWIVNETMRSRLVVGAGGHFCPVSRLLNKRDGRDPLVAAQEVEFAIDARDAAEVRIAPEKPELYFSRDLAGYGWCFRKGHYLNVGLGRLECRPDRTGPRRNQNLPASTAAFVDFLKAGQRIPADAAWRWRGHAYLLSGSKSRCAVGDGVMLVGDAAGLAYPQSGEGIRPAIESGLMAASAIVDANGRYTRDRLQPYADRLRIRYDAGSLARLLSPLVPAAASAAIGRRLLAQPWFVRRVVLDRWFLRSAS